LGRAGQIRLGSEQWVNCSEKKKKKKNRNAQWNEMESVQRAKYVADIFLGGHKTC